MEQAKIKIGKYEVGNGIGCWLRSYESDVEKGEVRFLADLLMVAGQVFKRRRFIFFGWKEVWWTPVDKTIGQSYGAMNEWRAKL